MVLTRAFALPNLSEDDKARILQSDSLLMPVLVDKKSVVEALRDGDSGSAPHERRMAFLVHLNVSQLVVTVFTTEEFADDKDAGVTEKD